MYHYWFYLYDRYDLLNPETPPFCISAHVAIIPLN